ncbi:molybdopterin-dependent oxidoreductase [uncultured Maricaulis sp.]|uniref:molybdopterin-dependent oxidoreductase n=1 Tax=uncultured Maricaulis sp. TaxID=174710 RepID=UPI0030DBC63F
MRSAILIAMGALSLSGCQPAAGPVAPGPDIVTVFGNGIRPDRGAMRPDEEPMFASYGLEFDSALGLTFAELAAFDRFTLTTDFPAGGQTHSFSGPLLRDVLADAGSADLTIRVTALDGYQREISAERARRHDVLLALYQDGHPLGLGGRGPAMLVWPRGSDPALAGMSDDDWVFGIFAIEALADPED